LAMMSVTHCENLLYCPREPFMKMACGQSATALAMGIADLTPNFLAS